MVSVSLRELLEAGVHFGHQTGRWNPKMKPYICAARNGIYIIDLQKTRTAWRRALDFLEELAAHNGKILFVGTKRQAADILAEQALRCGQFYVNHRWLGGLLTNYQTISRSIARYVELETMEEDGRFDLLPKKEVLSLRRELFKLKRNLIGIKTMGGLPDAVFVVDVKRERIAVAEAIKLGIPVVGVVDTNCDPDGIDYVIPGNDDAIRAIRLFCRLSSDAIVAGNAAQQGSAESADEEGEEIVSDPEAGTPENTTGETLGAPGTETETSNAEVTPAKKVHADGGSSEEGASNRGETPAVEEDADDDAGESDEAGSA